MNEAPDRRSQAALAPAPRTNGSALPSAISDMPIEDLDLPQRAFNSLKRHGITKVGQLLQTPDEELLRMRNFGKKSLDEIKERLAARGLIEPPEPSEASADLPDDARSDDAQSDDIDDTSDTSDTTETADADTSDTDTTGGDQIVAGEER